MISDLRRLLLLPLLVIGLPSCGSETAGGAAHGTIEGRVSLAPVMPVCRQGVPCDGVYAGAKIVARVRGGEALAHAQTNSAGEFRLDVPPGEYAVAVDADAALPRCSQAQVVVAAGATIRADIDCDTGIR